MIFDELYFNGGHYHPYQDFLHFAARASWIKNFMDANEYIHVTILGSCFSFLIKYLVEDHGFDSNSVLGIENSSYALSQADVLGYGVTQGYVINADIRTHTYGPTDLIISWNVLDCMANQTELNTVIGRINTINSVSQVHVFGASEDPTHAIYVADGYFHPSFFDVFSAMEMSAQDKPSYLVRSHDGYVYRVIRSGGGKLGTPYNNQEFDIPLVSWARITNGQPLGVSQ